MQALVLEYILQLLGGKLLLLSLIIVYIVYFKGKTASNLEAENILLDD